MDILAQLFNSFFVADGALGAAVNVPFVLEFGAVLAGSISGALVACDKNLDLVGATFLAMITSLGGGLFRDMILSDQGVYMLDHPECVLCCFGVALAAFFFSALLKRMSKPIAFFDILSVALFTVAGADKALVAGYSYIPGILLGSLTGVGGGMIRDVCIGRVPGIFQASNYYAVCSVLGAAVYCIIAEAHLAKSLAAVACVVVVIGLRYLSIRYNLQTTTPHDLSHHIFGRWLEKRAAKEDEEE